MRGKVTYEKVLRQAYKLAFGKVNDIAKLVSGQEPGDVKKLDLSQISEIKRGSAGISEIKLVDRLKLTELLLKTLQPRGEKEDERFWKSLFGSDEPPQHGGEA